MKCPEYRRLQPPLQSLRAWLCAASMLTLITAAPAQETEESGIVTRLEPLVVEGEKIERLTAPASSEQRRSMAKGPAAASLVDRREGRHTAGATVQARLDVTTG